MAADANVLEELRDIHSVALGGLADVLAAFSIGLFAAVFLAVALRAVTQRRESPTCEILARLRESRSLPHDERVVAQAALLRDLDRRLGVETGGDWRSRLEPHLGDGFFQTGPGAGLDEALYRRDADFDADRFHEALAESLIRLKA